MSAVHVFTAPTQPATKWVDRCSGHPMRGGWLGGSVIVAHCCFEPRRARNCVVQCFYDGMSIWCAPGKGCKDPAKLAAKKRREFRNRSAAQRLAWQRRKAKTKTGGGLLTRAMYDGLGFGPQVPDARTHWIGGR